jgi:hypothetical protein
MITESGHSVLYKDTKRPEVLIFPGIAESASSGK